MVSGYPWSFTTSAAEITMTLDPASPKWDQPFTANVHVTGAGEGDTISIDWGDGPAPLKYLQCLLAETLQQPMYTTSIP